MTRILLVAALCLTVLAANARAVDIETKDKDAKLLDAMIGQMLMVGFLGSSENDRGVIAVRDQLAKGIIGGVVLYPENIGTPDQLRALTAYLRNAKTFPRPFIAVDQEGGKVQRLTRRNGYSYFPSALSVGRNPSFASLDSAMKLYSTMAEQLAHAGFNLNFGPVLDLNLNPSNPVMARGIAASAPTRPSSPCWRALSSPRIAMLGSSPWRNTFPATARAASTVTNRSPTFHRAGRRSSSNRIARWPRTACSTR
jgi:hypothetical protein